MDKSPIPGVNSSNVGVDKAALASLLAQISNQSELVILRQALGTNSHLHIVGGIIRELAQGQDKTDLDLATCLRPQELAAKLQNFPEIRIIPTGITHGTITLLINNKSIELTTFRQPGSRNENSFSDDIITDLSGRDFTCNAIAYDIENNNLIDPYQGLKDIEHKILRAVGDATTRFNEDPLRMLRMVRLGTARGFSIDPTLLTATKALATHLKTVSVERIRVEFEKILVGQNISESIRCLVDTGLIELFLPEILPSIGLEQNDWHIHDVYEHTLWVMERTPQDLILRLAAFFHDIGKPESLSIGEDGRRHFYEHEKISLRICKEVMTRFKFSNDMIDTVGLLVNTHMRPLQLTDKGVRRLIRDLGENIANWQAIKRADKPPKQPEAEFELEMQEFEKKLAKEDQRLYQSQRSGLEIKGQDLIDVLGLKPGPNLGRILKALEEVILDDPSANTRANLLDLARELI